jgi:alanine-synthesizing transaminase
MFADRTNWSLAPNRLSEALERLRGEGKPIIDLTVSNPTECGFEYDAPAILGALQNPAALSYEPNPRGLESARCAIAEYYAEHGARVDIESIFQTTSTSEVYTYIFRLLCNPGDEVLVPAPSYPLFGFLADIQDVKLVYYPLLYDYGWQIDFHALKQAITPRTRAIIVVHPNNPTGHYAKPHEVAQVNEICRSNDLAIIADEVFLDFGFLAEGEKRSEGFLNAAGTSPVRPLTFAGNADVLTFTLSGLSKISGLPQMKAAWAVVNGPELLRTQALERLEVIADTFLSPSMPVQLALPALLKLRHGFQAQLLSRVRANLRELDRQLAGNPACGRLQVEGGWYAVVRVPVTRSDEEFAIQLLRMNGVLIHPGHFFDFPGEGHLVVSLIAEVGAFATGVERLLALVLEVG